jgi:DNA polymerase III gamma/tau subunit
MELYREYRPRRFVDVIGQDEAVDLIKRKLKSEYPHVTLIHGPSGTGKTTLARIVAKRLKCEGHDFQEMNTADFKGIETIRGIRRVINQAPLIGESKVWLFDECHKLTSDAQNSLLKILEEPPNHVYFFLCTTEPEKMLKTIQRRCMKVRLKTIELRDLQSIIHHVCEKEDVKFSDDVLEKISEYAFGSAGEALQILDSIIEMEDEDAIIEFIEESSIKTKVDKIAAKLLKIETKWKPMAALLKELKDEDAERIRRGIMGYAQAVLLNGDNARAFRMMELFRDNFYDCGFAGVVAGCYEVING